MSILSEINWHAEALSFCRENNVCPTETTLATVKQAMQYGSIIGATQAVKQTTALVERATQELIECRKQNLAGGSVETKMMETLKLE
jgi:hypothetical protein